MTRIIIVAIAFQIFFCLNASAKQCFKNDDCTPTSHHCCAVQGYCVPLPFPICRGNTDVTSVGDGDDGVNYANATFYPHKAEENRWDLTSASAYCSALLADKPLAWRKKNGWTSFCASHDPKYKVCGKCLKVTDTMTGTHEIVRIIDKCSNKRGLKLDNTIFHKLDTTENGKIQGHLTVKYEFADCKE